MRLIDADKIDFNEVFKGASDFAKDTREAAQNLIDAQPTIEAQPMRYSEWVYIEDKGMSEIYGCTQCGTRRVAHLRSPFCPGCGANMTKRTDLN